ncbi:MAG TPA: radical SAM protein, partial [Polyangia bacterium]
MSNGLSVAVPRVHGARSQELHKRALHERMPIMGGVELTHRCNLACIHCYVNLPAADREAMERELTTDEWRAVFDQAADAGVLWLTITGGEPLLRPDFCEIYEHAHDRGMVLTIYTNATMITERHIELWRRRPPRALEITQYGWTRETYDNVTDAGAHFDRFHRGLERVRQAGVAVTLKAIAMKASAHELVHIRNFARQEGLGFRYDAVLSPRIDGGRGPLAQRLSPVEVAAIEAVDEDRATAFAEYCHSTTGTRPADDRKYQCGAGLASFLIDPYGKMHVCELSRRPGWDVLTGGLAEGFRTAFGKLREEKRADVSGCGTCTTATVCSNCVGMSELEARSADGGDPYFCQMTDARGERV